MLRLGCQNSARRAQVRFASNERGASEVGAYADIELAGQLQPTVDAGESISQRAEVNGWFIHRRRSQRRAQIFYMVNLVSRRAVARNAAGDDPKSGNHVPSGGGTTFLRLCDHAKLHQRCAVGGHSVELGFQIFQVEGKVKNFGVGDGARSIGFAQETAARHDLAQSFREALEDCQLQGIEEAILNVNGNAIDLHPIVHHEIYRVGYEAIHNACKHAKSTRLEVELTYHPDFKLMIRDNGEGIDPSFVAHGKEGHFGLQSMRERAVRIGGNFQLISSRGAGTTIILTVRRKSAFRHKTKLGRTLFRNSKKTSVDTDDFQAGA